jgi:hypothetical protein
MSVRLACEIPEHFAAAGPEIGSLEAMNGNECAADCTPNDDIYEDCTWDLKKPGCSASAMMRVLPNVCVAIPRHHFASSKVLQSTPVSINHHPQPHHS